MIIRSFRNGDLAGLHRINSANEPAVGAVTEDDLAKLINISFATLVAEDDGVAAGFVLALVENADYASLNYAWISEKHSSFAYVDRVAVDAEFRNMGIGQLATSQFIDNVAFDGFSRIHVFTGSAQSRRC